jgi:lysophospholipase L1-like esterase
VTDGATQVAIIGDSFVTGALSPALQPALATLDPGASSFANYAVAGVSLASGGIGAFIPTQLTSALAKPVTLLIMDGGFTDLLICDAAKYPGCSTTCSSAGAAAATVCQSIVQAAVDAAKGALAKAANAGVEDVIYFFVPHLPAAGSGGAGYDDILDYAEAKTKAACDAAATTTGKLSCHFVSTVNAFKAVGGDKNAANFAADGIHPSAAGQTIIATQIWNEMKADCLGQASGCCH